MNILLSYCSFLGSLFVDESTSGPIVVVPLVCLEEHPMLLTQLTPMAKIYTPIQDAVDVVHLQFIPKLLHLLPVEVNLPNLLLPKESYKVFLILVFHI